MNKKCQITRYDMTITEPPFLSNVIDSMEVDEPEKDDLGEEFYVVLLAACRKRGYMFKFFTSSREPGYDYNVFVE